MMHSAFGPLVNEATDDDDVLVSGGWVVGLGGSDTLVGDDSDDILIGYGAQDSLGDMGDGIDGSDMALGGDGADWLIGCAGDDTLLGGDGDDLIWGGAATSAPKPTDGNDWCDGGKGADYVRGNYGDDTLFGGAGDDNMGGQSGDDILVGGAGTDAASYFLIYETAPVIFNGKAFRPGDTCMLADGFGGHDMLVGIEALIITGSQYADRLTGSRAGDGLYGGDGDDRIDGGRGADSIAGQLGADRIKGGGGADRFSYEGVTDSVLSASDYITDLSNEDQIVLSGIDANVNRDGDQAFHIADALTGRAGDLVLSVSAGETLLMADTDGDGQADFAIRLAGDQSAFTNFVL